MFEKEVVIDGRGHIMGRLASIVAKQILSGQRVTVVRCDRINISGSLFRNALHRHEIVNKRINTNTRRGFKHFKAPSRLFFKAVRGMVPRKTAKGEAALGRLRVIDGIPFPYDHQKRMVVPEALKIIRLKSHRKFCSLGDLAANMGLTKQSLIETLEEKRKAKAEKFHELKSKKVAARARAMGDKTVAKFNDELKKYGF